MNYTLAYGRGSRSFELPDVLSVDVVEPDSMREIEGGGESAIDQALASPNGTGALSEIVNSTDRVGIIFSDITRATPYDLILPPLLRHLSHVPDENITFYNATGTHRINTPKELGSILGPEVLQRFRIVQNECEDKDAHRYLGTTRSGNQISILRDFVECDFKILTGFIEPHFFAGMSGGGKAVMPGLAALDTIQFNHSAHHMDHEQARWGITSGNPLWEDVREAALMAEPSFLLNVAMNNRKEITGVFAGDFDKAHEAGCAFVRDHAMARVDSAYDIVITSNAGYPLDLNMYQSVKGMSTARQIVRPQGHIVIAAECWDGIPSHGQYGRLLADAESPGELLAMVRQPGFAVQDMWQAQIHAMICDYARVHFYSENLDSKQIESSFMFPSTDIGETVNKLVDEGAGTRICVVPQGPLTIPYIGDTLDFPGSAH